MTVTYTRYGKLLIVASWLFTIGAAVQLVQRWGEPMGTAAVAMALNATARTHRKPVQM